MAEGWARALHNDCVVAMSAGTRPHGINTNAVAVMGEVGIDISHHQSTDIADVDHEQLDVVITVCADADMNCPTFTGNTRVIHVGFDDPPRLANSVESVDDPLACYRRVRDEIRDFVDTLPEIIR